MSKIKRSNLIFLFCLLFFSLFLHPALAFDGPDDPAGNISNVIDGVMDGNRIRMVFDNATKLGQWYNTPNAYTHNWPVSNGSMGNVMTNEINFLIGARVFITQDSVPVTNPVQIQALAAAGVLDTLFYLQTNSQNTEMDMDASNAIKWGFYPVPGYYNMDYRLPAKSNNPDTWPPAGWPAAGGGLKWAGEWNGRSGRGKIAADLECFFVVNDARDLEYIVPEAPVKYYPRPGKKIEYYDFPWGGLGIRVETRGYQWNNSLARDVIFWEYTISNISDYDLPDIAFGHWVQPLMGDDRDDVCHFDESMILSYCWDIDGYSTANSVDPGVMGFVILETPGLPADGIDNDNDGLIDEKNNNLPTALIGPMDGIANVPLFLDYYNLTEADLRQHWDADEDQDWRDGNDANNDGIYQSDEDPGDDIGLDGLAPGDLNYPGPDADGSECNHQPDFSPFIGCEPNFAVLDASESDMLGLTSFNVFPIPDMDKKNQYLFSDDKLMWNLVGEKQFEILAYPEEYPVMTFASGPVSLPAGESEKYSIAELHAIDDLGALNGDEHIAGNLFDLKKITQVMYESDYQFPKPPLTPILQAQASDEVITLTWNNSANENTREFYLNNANDFEGYKLFRYIVTNNNLEHGELIYQCDLADGLTGTVNYNNTPGMDFNLGNDTGIQYQFVDSAIKQGLTYVYVLTSYDFGITQENFPYFENFGIPPQECKFNVELDVAGNVKSLSQNTAKISIETEPAISTWWDVDRSNVLGSGTIVPEAVRKGSLKDGHVYKVIFTNQSLEDFPRSIYHNGLYSTNGFKVFDVTNGLSKLVYGDTTITDPITRVEYVTNPYSILMQNPDQFNPFWTIKPDKELYTDIFDGLRLKIQMPVDTATYCPEKSGWLYGNSPVKIIIPCYMSNRCGWDYQLVFTDQNNAFNSNFEIKTTTMVFDEYGFALRRNIIGKLSYSFYVQNINFIDPETGQPELLEIVTQDINENGSFDILEDRLIVGAVRSTGRRMDTVFIIDFRDLANTNELPQPGDVYKIGYLRPFFATDSVTFIVDKQKVHVVDDRTELITDYRLFDNYPNPFNPLTTLEFQVPVAATVKIKVYNMLGQEIKTLVNGMYKTGRHSVIWDGRDNTGNMVASGLYFYRMQAGDFVQVGKCMLLK